MHGDVVINMKSVWVGRGWAFRVLPESSFPKTWSVEHALSGGYNTGLKFLFLEKMHRASVQSPSTRCFAPSCWY